MEDVILIVIINRLTKNVDFTPLNHPTQTMAKLFFHKIFHLHGLYLHLLCDRDQTFRNNFWRELFHSKEHLILVLRSTPHPQIYGQSKVTYRTLLKQYLRCFTNKPEGCKYLRFNSASFQLIIKMPPFQAPYGIQPLQLTRQ